MRVLVVEDERRISSFVQRGLTEAGFDVDVCHDGEEGWHLASTGAFDVVVLDVMLPGRDGLSILRLLRERGSTVPVLLLTARGELDAKVEGLELGADDYLTKPFYVEELAARIHALVRRLNREQRSAIELGEVSIDLLTRRVSRRGVEVELTRREFALLEYLARSPGRVLTRTQILERVWGYDFDPRTNLVDVTIGRLRRKLDDPGLIETVRGVGYRATQERRP